LSTALKSSNLSKAVDRSSKGWYKRGSRTSGIYNTCAPQVRMATFSQHHVDGLDMALTPIQALMKSFPNTKEQEIR